MSYQSSIVRKRHVARGVGDLIDDALDTLDKLDSKECQGMAKGATSDIDAKRNDLVANWKPTGYYSPAQMQQLVTATINTLTSAAQAVQHAIADESFLPNDTLEGVLASLNKRMAEAQQFTSAVNEANTKSIQVIDSVGLKRWVLASMREASVALYAVSYVSCMKPWWAGAMSLAAGFFGGLYNIAKAIVGIVAAAGQAVLKIPDTVATLLEVAKWALILGGGYYLAVQADLVDDRFGWKRH
jgi:hypothetical protein